MNAEQLDGFIREAEHHLTKELLPFWLDRCKDDKNDNFITHFDQNGNDTGTEEKSLIFQTRCVYTFSSAARAGYERERYLEYDSHGVNFLINRMCDRYNGGFYWLFDREGKVKIDEKIIYGHSFAIYSLSENTLASGDSIGLEYACKTFDLLQKYAVDTLHGGYFEMFSSNCQLNRPGAAGGDRKALDVHMHPMEALNSLYEYSQQPIHRRKLQEVIDIMIRHILHPKYRTGVPQCFADWQVAPQIKFDIVWGWVFFTDKGTKAQADVIIPAMGIMWSLPGC